MKSDEKIIEKARELCSREDAECAIFISGFLAGYKECLRETQKDGKDNQ